MQYDLRSRSHAFAYAVTIFSSAFLLFQVQPLISKSILPWFGGTPAVWTTCMLFFQLLLFAGYAYAHFTIRRCSPGWQAIVHIVLLACALLLLPITPDAGWKPTGSEQPTLRIAALLLVSVGLPFFIVSSTGPLLQGWFSRTQPGSSPYRLYALSNLGSLLALISYPFVFEPAFATKMQGVIWSWGFLFFAICCGTCAIWMWRRSSTRSSDVRAPAPVDEIAHAAAPNWGDRLLWFALAMAASVMLLATTNQVCMDVAAVPFLWVLPLTLYLVSFILCFDSDRWYSRRLFTVAAAVSTVTVSTVLLKGAGVSLLAQVLIYFSALFFCAMVCHGELVRLKPAARHLTGFYLVIAAGGAAGGLFVGLLAPMLFPAFLELHVGILGCCVLTLIIFFRDRSWVLHSGRPRWAWVGMMLAVAGLAAVLRVQASETLDDAVSVSRNFYGVLRVVEEHQQDPGQHRFKLMHGRIMHGVQFVDESKRFEPTAYYGCRSGVGRALAGNAARPSGPQRVGVVGLGVGTLATYARHGDTYRFYEINPEVVRLAEKHFSYLSHCPGNVEIVLGDARLSLEQEPPQRFDLLALDAFSGDAIPTHLLTAEAFGIYLKHLAPSGVLAVHISNLHFDLQPVVAAAAEQHQLATVAILEPGDEAIGTWTSLWMLVSRQAERLDSETIQEDALPPVTQTILWTDDRSNLFEILR